MDDFSLIGRSSALFSKDIQLRETEMTQLIENSCFLVIGGAGSIGRAVTREIFKREPAKLHVVDISENNMVELVRDIRSTMGYNSADFQTFAIDCGSIEFEAMFSAKGPYDYVLNLSALKHVRSEKDPFTLMRMVSVNILNTLKTLDIARNGGAKKYFCVSTDKAANPVNMMGASKRIMELFLMRESLTQSISMARFANVAFSDGSLLHGFNQRYIKKQPFSVPNYIKRYFMTEQESGELCLISCLLGGNRDILFPKVGDDFPLIPFTDIAIRYLENNGFEPQLCDTEDEARQRAGELIKQKKWPCYFFDSDTTGEKKSEEFFTYNEELDISKFKTIGVIQNQPKFDSPKLDEFLHAISELKYQNKWTKTDVLNLFRGLLPNFEHVEKNKYLDDRM